MAATEARCLIINFKNEPIGELFKVVAQNVSHLKEEAMDKNPNHLKRVDICDLTVWRFTDRSLGLDDTDRKTLESQVRDAIENNKIKRLGAQLTIAELGLSDVETLVLRVPDYSSYKRMPDEIEQDSSSPEVKRLKKTVGEAAPSSLTPAGQFRNIAGRDHVIMCNRPFVLDTIPIELLDEAFGIFKTRCGMPPSKHALKFLAALAPVGCEWYGTEPDRVSEVRQVFEDYTGLRLHATPVPGTMYATDGDLYATVMPAVIRECKNEDGHALNKAIIYYARFLLEAFDDPRSYQNHNTRFPCILMIDKGSTLGFYGAVWDGHVRVDPLTPMFDLSTHHRDESGRHAIASALDAFIEAVAKIKTHYTQIGDAARANALPSSGHKNCHVQARKYLYMTSFDIDGREITLRYQERLRPTKLLFSAIDDDHPDSGPYIVKFTRRYSEEAHRYLASLGSAPTLWQCKKLPGGWTAVLMERSRYEVLRTLTLSKREQEKIQMKATKMVKMLHDSGFVHGDIRDVNLLVNCDSLLSDEVTEAEVHFIDFDWAGCIGEVTYPIDVNDETVRRPEGVEGGKLISERHDDEMIYYLFGSLWMDA